MVDDTIRFMRGYVGEIVFFLDREGRPTGLTLWREFQHMLPRGLTLKPGEEGIFRGNSTQIK